MMDISPRERSIEPPLSLGSVRPGPFSPTACCAGERLNACSTLHYCLAPTIQAENFRSPFLVRPFGFTRRSSAGRLMVWAHHMQRPPYNALAGGNGGLNSGIRGHRRSSEEVSGSCNLGTSCQTVGVGPFSLSRGTCRSRAPNGAGQSQRGGGGVPVTNASGRALPPVEEGCGHTSDGPGDDSPAGGTFVPPAGASQVGSFTLGHCSQCCWWSQVDSCAACGRSLSCTASVACSCWRCRRKGEPTVHRVRSPAVVAPLAPTLGGPLGCWREIVTYKISVG
uniref:Uncharacterized protein n=1 Tax=Trichuris muris TaxID=70415 RepID=A0A5S6QR80_TRIMR